MIEISRLRNPVQSYPWGSRTAIAELLGSEPTGEPQAELWTGAHPSAPSSVEIDGRWSSLAAAIDRAPEEILGRQVVARHGPTLPFLFKVLAAERALSIQAHPDRRQAAEGCRREDQLGVARQASGRNYRDGRHKPEVLHALTPFRLLRGFRPAEEILEQMRRLGVTEVLPELDEALAAGDLKRFLTTFLRLDPERWRRDLPRILRRLETRAAEDAAGWILKLARQFPDDRGVLAPLFLHLMELRPGEAIFTGPGILHAYLSGLGIELMANSDNVVRGGLTTKHVDTGELLAILRFEPLPPRLAGSRVDGAERRIETTATEFALDRLELTAGDAYHSGGERSVEILLCTAGRATITGGATELAVRQGDSLLIPARVPSYRIAGAATLFRARVPL